MKCFLPCFSSSKRQNHFSSKPAYTTIQPTHHDTDLEESIHWISHSKIENEEQKSQCVNNTDDLDLETPQCCIIENKDNHEEEKEECSDSLFSVSISCGKPVSKEENEVNSTPTKLYHAKDVSGSTLIVPFKEPKRPMNQSILEYRYRDCSDDDDLCNEKRGEEEEEEEEERSSESSLFSLSTDYNNCRKRISFSSTTEKESEGNNDDACSSVLNPIENVSAQGKVVKLAKATVLHSVKKDKENMNWNQVETSLKKNEEIGVDTSLSSWLVESENHTPKNVCYDEDRQILGALIVEEIRKYSPNVSSKSSRSLSPQETVGGQTRSSKSNKYGKDGKQDWSSTTIIKTRLEPAFEASVAQN